MGFLPFSQLYQPPDFNQPTKVYSDEWKALNRKWSRPAAYRGKGLAVNVPAGAGHTKPGPGCGAEPHVVGFDFDFALKETGSL